MNELKWTLWFSPIMMINSQEDFRHSYQLQLRDFTVIVVVIIVPLPLAHLQYATIITTAPPRSVCPSVSGLEHHPAQPSSSSLELRMAGVYDSPLHGGHPSAVATPSHIRHVHDAVANNGRLQSQQSSSHSPATNNNYSTKRQRGTEAAGIANKIQIDSDDACSNDAFVFAQQQRQQQQQYLLDIVAAANASPGSCYSASGSSSSSCSSPSVIGTSSAAAMNVNEM